jgi:hypothetical protein
VLAGFFVGVLDGLGTARSSPLEARFSAVRVGTGTGTGLGDSAAWTLVVFAGPRFIVAIAPATRRVATASPATTGISVRLRERARACLPDKSNPPSTTGPSLTVSGTHPYHFRPNGGYLVTERN